MFIFQFNLSCHKPVPHKRYHTRKTLQTPNNAGIYVQKFSVSFGYGHRIVAERCKRTALIFEKRTARVVGFETTHTAK